MSDEEVAAVVSYIRQAWGNGAAGRALVDAPEVNRYRSVPLD
jgi:mono/diheme cytochrome c family protein